MKQKYIYIWVSLLGLCFLCIGTVIYTVTHIEYTKTHRLPASTILTIKLGASSSTIAQQLVTAGLFKSYVAVKINMVWHRKARYLKAGEYAIPARYNLKSTLKLFMSGKVVLHPVTVPEGFSSQQILQLLNNDPHLIGPKLTTLPEGSILPETYAIPHGTTRAQLLQQMRQALTTFLATTWPHRSDHFLQTTEEAIILASVVEKETAIAHERSLIAAVFLNRLKKGMPLQSDPTVIYALSLLQQSPLTRGLSHQDLQLVHPFNTYHRNGLPPAPICHPGKAAIEAVLHPAHSQDLFFVADGSGGHVFAATFKKHHENHNKWRKIRKNLLGIKQVMALKK